MEKTMNIVKNTFSISPIRFTAVFMGMADVWLFAPEVVHAPSRLAKWVKAWLTTPRAWPKASHLPDTLPEQVWAYGAQWTCTKPHTDNPVHICLKYIVINE